MTTKTQIDPVNKVPDHLRNLMIEVCDIYGGEIGQRMEISKEFMTLEAFCQRYIVGQPTFATIIHPDTRVLEAVVVPIEVAGALDQMDENDKKDFNSFLLGSPNMKADLDQWVVNIYIVRPHKFF